jgi:PPOX class probable FMN-dependent enzyme
MTSEVTSLAALRELYPQPAGRTVLKQLAELDSHCARFISLSPFLVLATTSADGKADASPRGGSPGFVHVKDARTLLIPDARGNNRLDSLTNIIGTGQAGLLFMIPGINETLRVNGKAVLSIDAGDLALCADDRRTPKAVIRIVVEEAYLHCAKAFMRSGLWKREHQVARSALPSMGQMISEQTGITGPAETQEEMERRYAVDL